MIIKHTIHVVSSFLHACRNINTIFYSTHLALQVIVSQHINEQVFKLNIYLYFLTKKSMHFLRKKKKTSFHLIK